MKKLKTELTTEQKIKRRNFISFTLFGAYAAAAYGGWRWLYKSPDETAFFSLEINLHFHQEAFLLPCLQ